MSRDVVFAFFGVSWAAAERRGRVMPEDRLAGALVEKETLDTPELMEVLGDLPPWVTGAGTNGNGSARRTTARRRANK
jgi:hypothetical protein